MADATVDEYDVYHDSAQLGRVHDHEDGGWPTFSITLTYHVSGTDDLDVAHQAAQAFFDAVDWPEGIDLP